MSSIHQFKWYPMCKNEWNINLNSETSIYCLSEDFILGMHTILNKTLYRISGHWTSMRKGKRSDSVVWQKPYTHRQIQNVTWKHKNATEASIRQPLRTDLGRSFGVTINSQLVCLIRFTRSQPSSNHNSRVIKRTHIIKCVNNPPYRNWGPTANQSGEVIKMWYIKHIYFVK